MVVEQGPHDALVHAGGRYSKLWEALRRAERHAA
jgi:ABC-type multidrug transport system fused ATPase/permease subunit